MRFFPWPYLCYRDDDGNVTVSAKWGVYAVSETARWRWLATWRAMWSMIRFTWREWDR